MQPVLLYQWKLELYGCPKIQHLLDVEHFSSFDVESFPVLGLECGQGQRFWSELLQVCDEGRVRGVLDGCHAGGAGCGDVLLAVVDEEDIGGREAESFGGVGVDGRIGLGDAEAVREGVVREAFEPGKAGADAGFHCVAEVGEDSGGDLGAVELLGPADHGEIGLSPELGVGLDEGVELGRGERVMEVPGDVLPVGDAGERTAIVVVAVLPVDALEGLFLDAEDADHLPAGGWIGRSAENHAVVEQDSLDVGHGV
jgi:hypothetical protein